MNLKRWRRVWLPAYLIACCLALPAYIWLSRPAPHNEATPRRLIIVLDGVPYQTMAELHAEGRFRAFHQPARMISTFPSLTNPAMIEILHADDSPGYEDHYFDREHNRLVGGIPDRLRGGRFIQGSFRKQFHYHAPAFKGALAYVAAPVGAMAVAHADLIAFRRAFRASRAPVFVAYIGETDTLAHLGGAETLRSFLCLLDRTIAELAREQGGQLEVEMLSDHGNMFTEYRRVEIVEAIQRAGFTLEKSLTAPRSVVLPRYGLVGCAILFTAPEQRAALAALCAEVPGVDFAAYREGEAIHLISRRGHARILRRGDRYRYEAAGGDPLELRGIIDALRADGVLDEAGFVSQRDWLTATREHRYTDPLRRIFDGFNAHVRNRSDVIVSLENGYYLPSYLDRLTRLRATHGNLLQGESEGFAISTRQNLGSAVCGYELQRVFGFERVLRADSYFSEGGHCRLGPGLARMMNELSAADQ